MLVVKHVVGEQRVVPLHPPRTQLDGYCDVPWGLLNTKKFVLKKKCDSHYVLWPLVQGYPPF